VSGKTFAEGMAERCVQGHVDPRGADFVHLRDKAGRAVLSVAPREVHCPLGSALGFVRAAVAELVEAGVEEGRRQASEPSPEALAAARAEGHEAGIAVGWTRALAVAIREVEAQQEGVDLLRRSLARGQDDLRVAEAVRNAISEASPIQGGYDE
jgi:hypothetical protein